MSNLDFGGVSKITNLPDPTNPQDAATRAYVLANVGGGGAGTAVYKTIQLVDFGTTENDYVTTTVTNANVLSTHTFSFCVERYSTDGDPEDSILETIHVTKGVVVNNTSFDIHVHAPEGTWGRYNIHCTFL